MLNTTYRMNDVLSRWSSREFYDNLLVSHESVAGCRLKLKQTNGIWDHALDPDEPAIFIDLHHRGNTTRSQKEADVIAELIQAPSICPSSCITNWCGCAIPGARPQNPQPSSPDLTDEKPAEEIIVDTVERMQGQEREVVLVSLTTSSPGFASQLADFFFQPQRLNVAVTRPRTKLIIVGSSVVLKRSLLMQISRIG